MRDKSAMFLRLEIRKLLQEKLFVIFLVLCLCLNIGLSFAYNDARKTLHQFSEETFSGQGEKIYDELNGAALGTAYYNQRYIHSSILNQKMKEKYDRLQTAIDRLDDENADLDFYAGEITPLVHKSLFEYQLKALLVESVVFFSLLSLRTFSMERQNEMAALIYSTKRGRKIAKDKILANGIVGFLDCTVLFAASLMNFFMRWDFRNLWNRNVSSSFHYINDRNDSIYRKPFLTWTSLTVKEYFIGSLMLILLLLIAWWLLSNVTALLVRNDLFGGLFLGAILVLPYFGIKIFPGLQWSIPFYLSTLTFSVTIYDSHLWFTDLGHYSLIPYQEVWVVFAHLLIAVAAIGFVVQYFQKKEMI